MDHWVAPATRSGPGDQAASTFFIPTRIQIFTLFFFCDDQSFLAGRLRKVQTCFRVLAKLELGGDPLCEFACPTKFVVNAGHGSETTQRSDISLKYSSMLLQNTTQARARQRKL